MSRKISSLGVAVGLATGVLFGYFVGRDSVDPQKEYDKGYEDAKLEYQIKSGELTFDKNKDGHREIILYDEFGDEITHLLSRKDTDGGYYFEAFTKKGIEDILNTYTEDK